MTLPLATGFDDSRDAVPDQHAADHEEERDAINVLYANRARVLYADAGTLVASTTSATTLFTGTYSVPANFLTVKDRLHFIASGSCLLNNGSTKTLRWQASLGGQIFMDYTSDSSLSASATVHMWMCESWLSVKAVGGVFVSVVAVGPSRFTLVGAQAQGSVTSGAATNGNGYNTYNTLSFDTTSLAALDLKVTPSASSAAQSATCDQASLMWWPGT